MTRQEALHELYTIFGYGFYNERVDEALNMAIAALKQLSLPKIIIRQGEQEPCEYKRTDKRTETHACDCISRKDAIEALDQDVMGGLNYRRILRLLPSADRPKGQWVDDDEQQILMKKFIEKGENWKVCNICGAGMRVGAKYDTDEQYRDFFHNYCPNCGADMRGGPTLTPEEFAEKMAGIAENGDEERKHVAADSIMCELLKSLGFGEGVGIFEDMDKWYS